MLWHFVLPFKVTFWTLATLLGAAVLIAPVLRAKRSRIFLWGFPMVLLAFMPSCSIVMNIMDRSRFGIFDYDASQNIGDVRVERYLPPAARELTIDKYARGYRARFQVEPDLLEDWFDGVWDRYGEYSVDAKVPPQFLSLTREAFDAEFGGLGWPRPTEVVFYQGPVAENGAGFAIWYDSDTGLAYEKSHHW
ncbi:MAG: hypothetical protein OSA98_03705 [Rubripirellula sp.]|nr:hypothetical protein [Rubripirellula sp.]